MDGINPVVKRKYASTNAGASPSSPTLAGKSPTTLLFQKTKVFGAKAPAVVLTLEQIERKLPGFELQEMKAKDNCWVCEGWSDYAFELRSPVLGGEVYIHFEFEGYKGEQLRQKQAGIYKTHRMIPPGVHKYFYSFNGEY
jgi:hypothetical protein